jgi:hypothetical protein
MYIKINSRILFGPVNSNVHFEDWNCAISAPYWVSGYLNNNMTCSKFCLFLLCIDGHCTRPVLTFIEVKLSMLILAIFLLVRNVLVPLISFLDLYFIIAICDPFIPSVTDQSVDIFTWIWFLLIIVYSVSDFHAIFIDLY